jgi:hypothetical protein
MVCVGDSISITDTVDGGAGIWSVNNSSLASISASGRLTGISSGIDTVNYEVSNGCGSEIAHKTITINPLPTISEITGANTVCISSTATLADSISGGNWTSLTTSIATVSGTGVVSGISAGSDSIVYTVTNICGTINTVHAITVLGVPSTITGTTHVCVASTDSLFNTTAGGSWNSTGSGSVTIGTNGVVTGVNAGIVTVTYSTGCGTAASIILTVNPLPDAGVITGTDSVCEGATTTLFETATDGTWSASNSNVTVVGGVVSGILSGRDTISYTSITACGTQIAMQTVIINAAPVPGILSGPDTVCTSAHITLTASSSGGTWSATNLSALVAGGIVAGETTGIDTINYIVTSLYCGFAGTSKTVTILSIPNSGTITGDSSVCIGLYITLSDAAGTGVWSASNTTAFDSGRYVKGVSAGIDTISYTVTNYCGYNIAARTITVNSLPNAGSITGLDSVCQLHSAVLSDAITGGIWSSSTPSIATITSGDVLGISPGVDTIKYSVTNMCGTASTRILIFVRPSPDAGTITGPNNLCIGSHITLTDSVTGGIWISSNTLATVTGGIVTGSSVGIDTISYSVTNVCGTAENSKIITLDTVLFPVISGRVLLCLSGIYSLDTLIGTPGSGTWSSSNILDTISSAGILTAGVPGLDTIHYSVSNSCGVSDTSVVLFVLTTLECDSVLSVNKPGNSIISLMEVYPNPNSGMFTILFTTNADQKASIIISNIVGQEIKNFQIPTNKSIDVEINQGPGIYFISATTGNETVTKKVLVTK